MNRLMRMAYGHSGSRLQRVTVTGSLPVSSPTPLWLRLLLLAIWLVVLALVSRYALPKASLPMKTVIDISRLTVKPPPALEKPIRPKPERVPPVVSPPPPPEATPEPVVRKPLERQTIAPQAIEAIRPAITRPSTSNTPDVDAGRPRVTRERRAVDVEGASTPAIRPRREALTTEAPSEKTSISRARGATAMDVAAAKDRIAVVRRAPSGDFTGAGAETPQRPVIRSGRSAHPGEENAPRAVAARERTKIAGAAEGESSASIGLARGISLQSLEICSSPQLQEDGIRAILRVVGSRQSCTDSKGEFQFKGTKRISSFNLLIFPSPGRKPSNRCEELENAYTCLKTH